MSGVLVTRPMNRIARKGETMTTAAMATYAYDQIEQARTGLEHPSRKRGDGNRFAHAAALRLGSMAAIARTHWSGAAGRLLSELNA